MFYLSEVNMKRIIYADNAATTRIDPAVLEAMAPFTKEEYANASQPYSFSRKAKAAIKNAREEIAKCINAKPSEIFFTSGGTESDNWAIKGCAFADESRRATITSTIEHHAVLRSCQFIERLGYPVAYINPNSNGLITVEMLEQVIAGTTNLVSVATANNEIGTIQPINKLAEIAHRNGAFFHTDAVQAMGHIPVDVNELNVDLLSASAHMPKIIRNAIRCKKCGDIIESKTVHDFKFCSCGSCAVDGGHDYLRRCGNLGDWEELSEAEKVEDNGTLA